MPTWIQKILDAIGNVVPVERWVNALSNVLRTMGLAFILCFILILMLIVNDWGFSPNWRAFFVVFFGTIMAGTVLLILLLALSSGDLLYAPSERALRKGKRYGTDKAPKTKREDEIDAPAKPHPQLPTGGDAIEGQR